MKGDALPPADHALRYVRPTLRDGDAIDGSAFLPRGVTAVFSALADLKE